MTEAKAAAEAAAAELILNLDDQKLTFVEASTLPEMLLEHRGDGTVWCRWTDGSFVQVVRHSDAERQIRELKARIAEYERATGFRYA
jgi:hypothetical protein